MPTKEELKARLSPLAWRVTQESGTERPFTSPLLDRDEDESYHCVCCGAKLFVSDDKFDSGTGWPSWSAPAEGAPIEERRDASHGMVRVEARCGECDAHLGHVFDDGPAPTGQRYCINGAALEPRPR